MNINEYIELKKKPNRCEGDNILIEEYNKDLVKKYPFLGYSDTYEYTKIDNMPSGWRIAFQDKFLKELKEALVADNYLDLYRVTDIKEKWGSLRWYDNTDIVDDIIDKYEELSTKVCQYCGKPAEVVSKGWVGYFCKDCANRILDSEYEELESL